MTGIETLPERFWKKVDRSGGLDACWPWLAATIQGYPIFRNDVDRLVRRYLWFLMNGELKKGETYSCRHENVNCVNPSHIIKRSRKEYIQVSISRGKHFSPFVQPTAEDRAVYAMRAKEAVAANGTRHIITPEERRIGHLTRGCTIGQSGVTTKSSANLPTAERQILLKDPCVYCGKVSTEVDHIQPFARGGAHDWSNRSPSCLPCNRKKNDKGLLKFLVYHPLAGMYAGH